MNEKLSLKKGKCLYNPKGAAGEYAAVGCNFYRGCPYQCQYCYNRRGWTSKVVGVDHAVLRNVFTSPKIRPKKYAALSGEDYAMLCFRNDVAKNIDYLRVNGIFLSFTTDPMCPDAFDLSWKAACHATSLGIPVKILTKNASYSDSQMSLINSLPIQQRLLLAIGFTLTGRDDMEPNASPNASRIEMMRFLHDIGYRTFASIEPVIDFEGSFSMIMQTIGFCDLYMIGLLSHFKNYHVNNLDMDFLEITIFHLQQIYGLNIYLKESFLEKAFWYPLLYWTAPDYFTLSVTADFDMFHDKGRNPVNMAAAGIHTVNNILTDFLNENDLNHFKINCETEQLIGLINGFIKRYENGNMPSVTSFNESVGSFNKEDVRNLVKENDRFISFLSKYEKDIKHLPVDPGNPIPFSKMYDSLMGISKGFQLAIQNIVTLPITNDHPITIEK